MTGGTGFIGKNLVKQLIEDDHQVSITTFLGEKIPEKVDHIYGDLTKIRDRFDVVFHQAANNNTRDMNRDEMFRSNVYEPIAMFYNLYEAGCTNFIYASSTAVYGGSPAPYTEDTVVNPLNPYAESKLEFDKFAMNFTKNTGCFVKGLRYCNVYGIGEEHKGSRRSMVNQIYHALLADEQITLFEHGEQRRDWIYVKDVVKANIAAMSSCRSGLYNVGGGSSYSFKEVCQIVSDVLGKQLTVKWVPCPFPNEYQNYTKCDITKIGLELGWKPEYDLKKGLQSMCN